VTCDPLTVQFQQNRNANILIASSKPQSQLQNTALIVANMIVLTLQHRAVGTVLGSKHAEVADAQGESDWRNVRSQNPSIF
jgi:hypothetical protein